MQVSDLFTAHIEVPPDADHDYRLYLRPAFDQILLKLTGNSAALSQFASITETDLASAVKSYSISKNTLSIRFASDRIHSWLMSAKLPIWGDERPLLLVWVVIQQDGQSRLVAADGEESVTQTLADLSQQYGVPLELPLLDLDEVNRVSVDSLLQQDWATLNQVAQRYNAAGHLILKLAQHSQTKEWQASWSVRLGAHQWQWQHIGATLPEAVKPGVLSLNEHLSQVYAIAGNTSTEAIQVVIDNIHDYRAYQKALAYLKKLNPVRQIQIIEVAADRVIYQLQLEGGARALQQAVAVDSLLQPVESSAELPMALEYRLAS